MRSHVLLCAASLLLPGPATASFDGNLNYDSPSRRHPRLGIDVALVERRSWKRGSIAYEASQLHFTHGVASGDPWPESIILWTRVAPTNESDSSEVPVEGTVPLWSHETDRFAKADPNPICVEWKVFEIDDDDDDDDETRRPVTCGRAYTTSDVDYTVKVEAKGLRPLTKYSYQFNVCGPDSVKSPMGRTMTAPRKDDAVSKLRFAVFSCSNYAAGYFNVYGNAARKDEHDYVIHLGDYMYEYGKEGERATKPTKMLWTLHDYRTRHGLHRSDPDLQLLSQNSAWITTWDDHEFSDNGYRDGFVGLNNTEDSFLKSGAGISVDTRKVHAVRSYFEWMPIRQTDLDDGLRVWRSFQMGKLLDLVILDTRNYDRSITDLYWNKHYISLISDDPSRSLMGARQENWFYRTLSRSKRRGAIWRVIGNQIMFSRIFQDDHWTTNGDAWDGYVANRNRTLKHLYDNKIDNNLFLAGDTHQNWVSDLAWLGTKPYDQASGNGAIGVELGGTATSSTGQKGPIEPVAGDAARGMIRRNEELAWQEGYYRGYFHLTVTAEKSTAKYYGSPSVATRNGWDIPLANFTIYAGANHLDRPIGGGEAESGALRNGKIKHSNLTLDTNSGKWAVVGFDKMHVD
ncbi:hypothetical protein E4U09_006888 [Claviceps aff. purpurea]|uniref:Alkaline phosphatase D n=1 Tax=Claviceps aff. purpurea TaxID=1967640 RepID=A0A9P7QKE7_9HYPO|nr:hypothetical protein E4U09_006888 [Claviceps aff. purpurea]